jgi:hypothetical protein
MTALHEKIANLSPSLLPQMEHFIDSLQTPVDDWDDDSDDDPDWGPPPVDKNGKPIHPKAGCMKGIMIMHDNFFEPDDDWEDYM